jgi:MOSC domain-containing protein YiiM
MAKHAPDLSDTVVAVHRSAEYQFSKQTVDAVELIAGLGVADDAHSGATVQHRSRIERNPNQPNLRQVHLVASELLDEVNELGHSVRPGALGENITTAGLDLVHLPLGSVVRIGADALLAVTGRRNPCGQINDLGKGVLKKMFIEAPDGTKFGRTGIMSVVVAGGIVHPGDPVHVRYPSGDLTPLPLV